MLCLSFQQPYAWLVLQRAYEVDPGTLEFTAFIREQVSQGRMTRLDEDEIIPKEVDMGNEAESDAIERGFVDRKLEVLIDGLNAEASMGLPPTEIKQKEVDMDTNNTGANQLPVVSKIENFMGTGQTVELTPIPGQKGKRLHVVDPIVTNPTGEEPMLINKRTRKPRGVAPDIQIITSCTAIITRHIPKRPEGMEKVVIRIFTDDDEEDGIEISWPEGMTALEALSNYFNPTGMGINKSLRDA